MLASFIVIDMNYNELMKKAINEAKDGVKKGEQPYGALLIADGKIVATAHNEVVSSKNCLNHAEIVVINKYLDSVKQKPKDLTLITTCSPCLKCFGTAIKLGVNRFVYGSSIETAIKYGSNDLNMGIDEFKSIYDIEIISGVLENECDNLLEEFYFKNNVVTYSKGSNEEIFWMKKALEVGKRGMLEKDELPIGVLLVAGDKLLTKTSTLTYTLNSPITHGDFMALFNAEREVYSPNIERPLVLYSSLEPHLLGFGAAIKCKVDKVVFGLEAIPDGGSCYLKNMVGIKERIPQVIGGVLRDEQYKLMKEFLNTHEDNRVGYGYAKTLVKLYEEGR